MPSISTAEQRTLGRKIAEIIEPLPRDERLLFLIACLYGEAKAQGLSASQVVEKTAFVVRIHERGIKPLSILLSDTKCPTCGGAL